MNLATFSFKSKNDKQEETTSKKPNNASQFATTEKVSFLSLFGNKTTADQNEAILSKAFESNKSERKNTRPMDYKMNVKTNETSRENVGNSQKESQSDKKPPQGSTQFTFKRTLRSDDLNKPRRELSAGRLSVFRQPGSSVRTNNHIPALNNDSVTEIRSGNNFSFPSTSFISEGVDQTDQAIVAEKQLGQLTKHTRYPLRADKTVSSIEQKDYKWKYGTQTKPLPNASNAPKLGTGDNSSNAEELRLISKLKSLKGRECQRDEDKYFVLNERDNILYQLRAIRSDTIRNLSRCNEMCTEKERYQRIMQKRASPFECDKNNERISHELMVKEYARSAADQERPLPHELRSENTMNFTMTYLLQNILDTFPDSAEQKAAWFNFLWSRTRALRKEVTQLSLSDKLAVQLVEQCTRLHILFGYILCTLETDHFDQKMNNENLGKCLQTLRHLYEDFERRGIKCENEAEFRSYDVMMHLNDSNVLSQVLSYRNEIRQSKFVSLALQLSAAFQNNNYCRFFRLLQEKCTFLQCCVCHKLFNELRFKAISVMTLSYGRNAVFPVEKLCNLLAYDSLEETNNVLISLGLRIDGDQVILNRDDFLLSESLSMNPHKWIDEKNCSVYSQLVLGSDSIIPSSWKIGVVSSFDNHFYVNDVLLDTVTSICLQNTIGDSVSKREELFHQEVFKEELRKNLKAQHSVSHQAIGLCVDKVIDGAIYGFVEEERMKYSMIRKQEIAAENAKKLQEEKRRKLEDIERRDEFNKKTANELTEELLLNSIERISENLITRNMRQEKVRRENKLAANIADLFWVEFVMKTDNIVVQLTNSLLAERSMVTNKLDAFRYNINKQWLKQFWDSWRTYVNKKKLWRMNRRSSLEKCVATWEASVNESTRMDKYSISSVSDDCYHYDILKPTVVLNVVVVEKRRLRNLTRSFFRAWRNYAAEKKRVRQLAHSLHQRENKLTFWFDKNDTNETAFKFNKPSVLECRKRKPESFSLSGSPKTKKIVSSLLDENCDVYMDPLTEDLADSSISVARNRLFDWRPNTGKFKLSEGNPQSSDKDEFNKQLLEKETESSLQQVTSMRQLCSDTQAVLEDTESYTNELHNFINELKSRKIDNL